MWFRKKIPKKLDGKYITHLSVFCRDAKNVEKNLKKFPNTDHVFLVDKEHSIVPRGELPCDVNCMIYTQTKEEAYDFIKELSCKENVYRVHYILCIN